MAQSFTAPRRASAAPRSADNHLMRRSRRCCLAVCSLLLLAPATAAARRPVVSYIDEHGALRLYDAAMEKDIHPPPVPTFRPIKQFRYGISANGRYVVYNDSAQNLHLLDHARRSEVPLPGVNVYTNPGNLSVSNSGRIAFDNNGNGPARVYDGVRRRLVDTGLPADNGHRQTRVSADGHFLASSCTERCISDTGGGADVFLQDLRTRSDTGFAADKSRDEEYPCLNGDGSRLALDAAAAPPADQQHDVFLFRNGLLWSLDTGVPNEEDQYCALDPSGGFLSFVTAPTTFKLYDMWGKFVTSPADRQFDRISVLTNEFRGDRTRPSVRRFRITPRRFAVGRGATAFRFVLSEPARVRNYVWRHGSRSGRFAAAAARAQAQSRSTAASAAAHSPHGGATSRSCARPTRPPTARAQRSSCSTCSPAPDIAVN
jgi:hypothetical protein